MMGECVKWGLLPCDDTIMRLCLFLSPVGMGG